MGAEARRIVMEHYTMDQIGPAVVRLFEEVRAGRISTKKNQWEKRNTHAHSGNRQNKNVA